MASLIEYAQLAGRAYVRDRSPENLPFLPEGWSVLYETPIQPSGFQAGIYTNGSEVVIAFGGTSGTDVLNDPGALADWTNNLQLGLGFAGQQLYEAVRLYAEVSRGDFGTAGLPVTVTGHSLGGGLASLIAGLFGVSATTFAMAPFEIALNPDNIRRLSEDLSGLGFAQQAAGG